MKVECKITISRNSNDKINITLFDESSRIQFFDGDMLPEDFTKVITGLGYQPIETEVRGLEHVGKKKVVEKRQIPTPFKSWDSQRASQWLKDNYKEDGWMTDPYLGSQNSVSYKNDGTIAINFSVYKYV